MTISNRPPRIGLTSPPPADPHLLRLRQAFEPSLGFVPNSLIYMLQVPGLADAVVRLNQSAMNQGTVDPGLKRLAAYMVSRAAGCRYCMSHTIRGAASLGVDQAKLDALWEFRTHPAYSAAERAALEFVLATAQVPNAVDESTMAQVRLHWNDSQVLELLAVASLFAFMNRWNDSLATPLEHGPAESSGATGA